MRRTAILITLVMMTLGGRAAMERRTASGPAPDASAWDEPAETRRAERAPSAHATAQGTPRAARLPAGAPRTLAPALGALRRQRFAEAEREALALLKDPPADATARGWVIYTAAEAVWAQGRLGEAKSLYERFLREHAGHRAEPNARAAVEYIDAFPRHKQELAARRSE